MKGIGEGGSLGKGVDKKREGYDRHLECNNSTQYKLVIPT